MVVCIGLGVGKHGYLKGTVYLPVDPFLITGIDAKCLYSHLLKISLVVGIGLGTGKYGD